MMTPPLASVTSVEKIPDREWVPSDCKAENPGIRKEGDKLRLDSWIQIRFLFFFPAHTEQGKMGQGLA